MERIRHGFFDIKNPYTQVLKKVEVSKESFHSIVFWSKNYGPFLHSGAGQTLQTLGFKLYFNFTINSESALLEPEVPPLKQRLRQLKQLASDFGPDNIAWRFDPICFFKTDGNPTKSVKPVKENNLADFVLISEHAAKIGIKKCITSFMDDYPKIQKRLKRLYSKTGRAFSFIDPDMESKIRLIQRMEKHLKALDISLFLCCEKDLFASLGKTATVRENACIDGKHLKKLFGGNPETKRDYGQRAAQGCKCTKSIDVGSYKDHPCLHNCLFCYAN